MIRLLLVDDHTLVREALRVALEQDSDMQVVGEAGDGESALRRALDVTPDVVLMDVALPGVNGIEITRRLRARQPHVKVLALSTYVDRRVVEQMLDAGASGYISKSAAGTELRRGIRTILAGRSCFCPEVADLLATALRNPGAPDAEPLSPRELQIATLLAEGKSAPEIADTLHIAGGTVDAHRRNIMRKLDLHGAVALTRYAIRAGWIDA